MSPFLILIALVFIPESPHFLLMKGRKKDARKAFSWLNREDKKEIEFSNLNLEFLSKNKTFQAMTLRFFLGPSLFGEQFVDWLLLKLSSDQLKSERFSILTILISHTGQEVNICERWSLLTDQLSNKVIWYVHLFTWENSSLMMVKIS